MRSSRSRMPTRLRPNGERTSVYMLKSESANNPKHQVEERHLVGEVDAEFGALPQIDAVVAAGQRVPAVGEPPYALSERERDHQKIDPGGADREQPEQRGKRGAAEHAEHHDEPEIIAQPELIARRQDRG